MALKNLIEDERADSMIVFGLVLGVLLFGVAYICLNEAVNLPIGQLNTMIGNGIISQTTLENMQRSLDLWKFLPWVFAIGTVIFLFERSKGVSVSSTTYLGYIVLLIVANVFSTFLVWGFGLVIDQLTASFNTEFFLNYSPEFDVSGMRGFLTQLIYYACLMPAVIGDILYCLFPITKQTESTFMNFEDEVSDSVNGEYITQYNFEQR